MGLSAERVLLRQVKVEEASMVAMHMMIRCDSIGNWPLRDGGAKGVAENEGVRWKVNTKNVEAGKSYIFSRRGF